MTELSAWHWLWIVPLLAVSFCLFWGWVIDLLSPPMSEDERREREGMEGSV